MKKLVKTLKINKIDLTGKIEISEKLVKPLKINKLLMFSKNQNVLKIIIFQEFRVSDVF